MSDDYFYYKERCKELENELSIAQKTIVKLERRLYDIRQAIKTRSTQDSNEMLGSIAWIAYDWKD